MNASATVLPEKATHQQMRTFNQQLVLRALHDHSPLSRADLARLTGLTRTSVGDLVGTLIDDGLIEEVGRGQSTGGKSPILLRVAPDGRHLIGLDLGEAFSGAVVNLRGEILRSIHLPLDGRNGDAAVELVFQLVDALRADDRSPLLGIGIGAPGVIDTSTGTVRWSVNLNWADLRLGPLLEQRYGVPVVVANDSHAAALAELTFFRRPRPNNLIVIKVGRGVGAGIILNGQLFQGDGYGAGEFGHVSMGSADAPCRCGRVGCLETMTSMRALVDAAGAVEPSITDESGLVAAFLAGVTAIRRIVLDAARELGVAIGWLIGVLNVRYVLLVGPVAAFGDDWLGEVRQLGAFERPGTARTRHADRVRPRPRRRGRAGRVGAAHGAAAGPGVGAMIATYEPGLDGPLVAGVDVGGTKTSIVVTDDRDRILYEHVTPTDRSSLVGQIAGLVDDARRQLRQDVAAVGVAIPGHVDAEDGSVSMAVNLGIIHLPLGPMLQAELGVPTFVEHDARAAALWLSEQATDGPALAPASVAFLAIGTGISAGVVIDGALLRGDNGFAGEVGHVVADPDGAVCACGLRGCLETIAAGPAIARQADEAMAAGRSTVLSPHPSAADVFRASSAGDAVAVEITDRVADHLARAIRSLVLTLGVKRVVIGGGVAAAGPALLESIQSSIARERAASPLVEAALGDATVELLSPTEAPGARGAAAIARQGIGLPEREGVGER